MQLYENRMLRHEPPCDQCEAYEVTKPCRSCEPSGIQLAFDDKHLFSVFQPIYSFSNQACVGVEALVRGRAPVDGFPLPVNQCLAVPAGMSFADYSHVLNRLHLQNWQKIKWPDSWLFLNFDFEGLNDVAQIGIEPVLQQLKVNGYEVVIEVVESEITDEGMFERLIATLRRIGCLIALDDFGAGHSNVDRIWKAQPDIVKLDRGVLLEASKSVRGQSILKNLTRLIKEAGSVCLLEGVETREQALLAMDAGVDLVQGFYFARPAQLLDQVEKGQACITEVVANYPQYLGEKRLKEQIRHQGFQVLFQSIEVCDSFDSLTEAMQALVGQLSFVKRFFILDEHGYQVSEECNAPDSQQGVEVLKKGKGLCWKNRRYFRKAQQNHGALHVSEPYRSLIDMQLCLTLSRQVQLCDGVFVVCFDVRYQD